MSNFVTTFGTWFYFGPSLLVHYVRPSIVQNKIHFLHSFEEKKIDIKLARVFDSAVTQWEDEVDEATLHDAISRSI